MKKKRKKETHTHTWAEIEQEPGCKSIRTDPHKKGFDIFRTTNQRFRHSKQSAKKKL